MANKEKIIVKNYAAFLPFENDEKPYRIINNDTGEEAGIEVRGLLTTFDMVNQNGQRFERKSYDRFVTEYFEANNLNIPIDIMHKDDAQHLAGVATKFVKKDGGVEITAFIPKGVYFYGLIKVLLDNGILQGFSNYGYIADYEWDRQNDEIIVKEFALLSASLVSIPADVGGKFIANATEFKGFEQYEELKDTKNTNLSIFGL